MPPMPLRELSVEEIPNLLWRRREGKEERKRGK
jgi:hypothetical protein